ncbi:hemolysin, partial [Klebsiella pneumoniae]
MKKLLAILPLALAGCTQPQPTAPTKTIGMPNPAAVYCQQSGGTRVPVQNAAGRQHSVQKLPSGETLDEWALWRR